MNAVFATKDDSYKQDEITVRQLHARKDHQRPREKKLGLFDLKAMHFQMRDQI